MFTGITTRVRLKNRPEKNNFIYAVWHAQLAFMLDSHRGMGLSALVSRSADGEYLARILRKFGHNTVRGSTSRGASQALMELIERAAGGFSVAITPDGPKGPKEKVQQGVIYLAQKTGMRILPAAISLSNKITFNSWDNFELPLPFGKAVMVYGDPISVSETDLMPAKSAELENVLNALKTEALELLKQ